MMEKTDLARISFDEMLHESIKDKRFIVCGMMFTYMIIKIKTWFCESENTYSIIDVIRLETGEYDKLFVDECVLGYLEFM